VSARTVGQIGESGVIKLITPYLHSPADRLLVSIGDDCAVIACGEEYPLQVLTTDLLVEETHFLRSVATDWYALGRRAVVANVSDLAAMGALPDTLLCSVGLPSDLRVDALTQLYSGIRFECDKWVARFVGGDTVRSSHVTLSITATGRKSGSDAACLRSACVPGQHVYVTGALGGCRAGLDLQMRGRPAEILEGTVASLIVRQQVPEPRVAIGRYLAGHHKDVAIIDISDSLYNEMHLLAAASHVGMDVWLEAVPVYPGVEEFVGQQKMDLKQFALFSGEEYELLFCSHVSPTELQQALLARGISTPVTQIGMVIGGSEVVFRDSTGNPVALKDQTFRHLV
jgi:thiamine-monophosphate kinase